MDDHLVFLLTVSRYKTLDKDVGEIGHQMLKGRHGQRGCREYYAAGVASLRN
jgi:hypothetical protein